METIDDQFAQAVRTANHLGQALRAPVMYPVMTEETLRLLCLTLPALEVTYTWDRRRACWRHPQVALSTVDQLVELAGQAAAFASQES
jgi:hypothetical protein